MAAAEDSSLSGTEVVAIVGVGLIGGSIAAALKKRGHRGKILGVGRNTVRLESARSAGVIDAGIVELPVAAAEADIVIFCTPVDRIAEGVKNAAKSCRPGTILSDAGSVKATICRALTGSLPREVSFIGSHPVAGSEKQGFEHADPELFDGRVCVVTPESSTPAPALAKLKQLWQRLGMIVVEMSPDEHDRALAATSHLPHVVAAALSATLSPGHRQFAGSGFCDTTRIAAGDPELWAAIFLANADELLSRIDGFDENLRLVRTAIANRDSAALKKLLQVAKTARDSVDCGKKPRSTP